MMIQHSKILGVVLALLLAPLALGITITEVTASGPTTSVTTGTSVTIPVVVKSDSSGTASQIYLTSTGRSGGSSLTTSDPSSGSYTSTSVTSSGTTVNFVVSAGVADTYDYFATATYTGGSTPSVTSVLQVVAPSALAVTGSVNSTSHSVGTVFGVTVNVGNPTSANVTSSYALTFAAPSAFTLISGDSASGTMTLEPSSSVTYNYVIRAEAAASSSAVNFGIGSSSAALTQAATNTALAWTPASTPVTSGGSGSSTSTTPTPKASATVSPTTQPFIPAPKTSTGAAEPVVESKSRVVGTTTAVTGNFGENSATVELAYTAPTDFSGDLTHTVPLDFADYQAGLITFDPEPITVAPGSIVATWAITLAAGETFIAKMDVAKKVDPQILNEFKAPRLAPRSSSVPAAAPTSPASAPSDSATGPAPAATDNTLLYVIGALVVLGLLYYFVAMRKK